ncbi:hypothetical protein WDW37_10995 [Bdellovibrionota bacterium FG-1]
MNRYYRAGLFALLAAGFYYFWRNREQISQSVDSNVTRIKHRIQPQIDKVMDAFKQSAA